MERSEDIFIRAGTPPAPPSVSRMVRRRRARRRRRRRAAAWAVAVGLAGAGVVVVAEAGLFQWRYHRVGHALVVHERASITRVRATPGACTSLAGDGPVTVLDGVAVHGNLVAPSIGLDAPVVEGNGDAQLAIAVGHDSASTWPAPLGTTVLSGHDVTWFSQVAKLAPGSMVEFVTPCVTYQYAVTGSHVVPAGSQVLSGPDGKLDLVTCYPLNALYLTPNRYVVESNLVKVLDAGRPVAVPPAYFVPWVPAPAPLADQGLDLASNETPLGSLTLEGQPSAAWMQSSAPLQTHEALLALYFGALRSAEQNQPAWWAQLAPSVPFAAAHALAGGDVVGNDLRLESTMTVDGSTVTGATLTGAPVLSGADGGHYTVSMSAAVVGGVFQITAFTLQPA